MTKEIREIKKIIKKDRESGDTEDIIVFLSKNDVRNIAKEIAKLQNDRIEVIGREYLAELKEEFKYIWSDNQKELLRRMGVENGK